MAKDIEYYNSQEAARILGVNVSTIKRWTDDGRLECIRTAGGHRKFVMSQLSKFLNENRNQTSKINLFPLENETDLKISNYILKGNFSLLIEYVQNQAFACNRTKLQKVLNGLYLAQYPLHIIFDRVITPVLRDIGMLWMNGKISIIEEHLATATIRDGIFRLQGIIQLPSTSSGRALCLSMAEEMHDIALKMVDHVLETRGFRVMFSGQNTPMIDFEQVVKTYKPNRVYVSSSFITDKEASQKEFDQMCATCEKYDVKIFIGGNGFDILNFDHPAVVRRLFTFEEVFNI